MASQNKGKRLPHFTARKVWFLGEELVSIHHHSEARGIVVLYAWNTGRKFSITLKDFKRFRKRAFTLTETADLLERERVHMKSMVNKGILPRAMGRGLNGEQKGTGPAYYREEQIFEMRAIMASIHRGRPRKDGLVTNNSTPTEAELRAKINNHLLVYVKDEDGSYVPLIDTYYGQ